MKYNLFTKTMLFMSTFSLISTPLVEAQDQCCGYNVSCQQPCCQGPGNCCYMPCSSIMLWGGILLGAAAGAAAGAAVSSSKHGKRGPCGPVGPCGPCGIDGKGCAFPKDLPGSSLAIVCNINLYYTNGPTSVTFACTPFVILPDQSINVGSPLNLTVVNMQSNDDISLPLDLISQPFFGDYVIGVRIANIDQKGNPFDMIDLHTEFAPLITATRSTEAPTTTNLNIQANSHNFTTTSNTTGETQITGNFAYNTVFIP